MKQEQGMNVTERSRKLLRDIRLRGGLKVRCFSALSYFFVQWRFPNEKMKVEMYETGIIELAGW